MDVNLTEELRERFAGIRVRTKWWGTKKTLGKEQKRELAEACDVDEKFIAASKKLIDTKHPAYSACEKVKREAKAYWKEHTINFPEDGVRLLRKDMMDEFSNQYVSFSSQLDQAVAGLAAVYSDLSYEGRQGCRFNSLSDYPMSIEDLFAITWEVVNLDPPEYLRVSHERLYQREQARIQGLLAQTIQNTEQAFYEEFQKLLQHLVTHLGDDKQFHKAQIDNLKKFFGRFRELNVTGNDELETLVAQSEALVSGVKIESLKDSEGVRNVVREAMGTISGKLDDLVVNRPKRAIRFED